MRRFQSFLVFGVTLSLVLSMVSIPSANAYMDFYKVFAASYIGDQSTQAQLDLAAAAKELKKCGLCHNPNPVDGKVSKKNRNPYGEALAEFLTKNDKKDLEKIKKALEDVADKKAEGADESFGERVNAGKAPYLYD